MFTSIQIQAQTIYKTHQTHVPKYLAHVSLFVAKLRIGEDSCMKKIGRRYHYLGICWATDKPKKLFNNPSPKYFLQSIEEIKSNSLSKFTNRYSPSIANIQSSKHNNYQNQRKKKRIHTKDKLFYTADQTHLKP